MLIALITYLFLGGGPAVGAMQYFETAQGNLEYAIVDEDQRGEVAETLAAFELRTKQHGKAVRELAGNLRKSLKGRDASAADRDTLWDRYFELKANYDRDAIELRFRLRDQVSRDQWEALFAERTD